MVCSSLFSSGKAGKRPTLILVLALILVAMAGCNPEASPAEEMAAATPVAPTAGAADATPATPVAPTPGNVVTRIVQRFTLVTSTPPPDRPVEEEAEPVTLDIALTGALADLDPHRISGESQRDLAENLFAGLTNYNPETNEVEPELAVSWQVGPDGRTWTFRLRDDVYWVRPVRPAPGESQWSAQPVRPVTADDVVFAVERFCSREVESPLTYLLFAIEGCERVHTTVNATPADLSGIGIRALDATTLEVKLEKPAGYFPILTTLPFFYPAPRDLVTELGAEWQNAAGQTGSGWQTPDNLVTSGPYLAPPPEITSARIALHRNPLWPIQRGGNADIVNVLFLGDETDAYELWQERVVDTAPLPASERSAALERSPEKVRFLADQIMFYLGFNFGSQVFAEPEARRAFSAAIDRERLVEELFDNSAIPMRHLTPPGVAGAAPVDQAGVGYSPDYARQQMAASSFRSCRLMPPITFLVSSADLSLRVAELVRDMWVEELECPEESIDIVQVQFGELLADTRAGAGRARPDMWELAWAPAFPDAHNYLSDLLHCADSENRQERECADVDTLLRRAASSVDLAQRADLYRQAENALFGEGGLFPIAPLYTSGRELIVHDWVQFSPALFGGEQYDTYVIDAMTKNLERSR